MSSPSTPQRTIAAACEEYFERHGDSYLGVGWTKSQDEVDLRYEVMLGVIDHPAGEPVELLDVGCGLAHLYEYMQRKPRGRAITYTGLDISPAMLEAARAKHPEITFYEVDLMEDGVDLPRFDYVVMNGVFTLKAELTQDAMLAYWQEMLARVFPLARRGIAFNVMSPIVDWERDDLFHVPFETLTRVVSGLSRRFVIRHDYPLYEYTTYVFRDAEPAREP